MDDALDAFTRDFAATQASDAYSNATFVLSLTGLFATLNQVVAHLVTEHVVHVPRLLLKVACSCPYSLRVGGSTCSLQKGARPTAPARSGSSAMYARSSATRLI